MTEWWTAQAGNMIGAYAGAGVGVLGALMGSTVPLLLRVGRGRVPVLASMTLILVAGLATLVIGFVALAQHQPRHVWFPLLLVGGVTSLVFGGLTPMISMMYRQAEHRRMAAHDLRAGG